MPMLTGEQLPEHRMLTSGVYGSKMICQCACGWRSPLLQHSLAKQALIEHIDTMFVRSLSPDPQLDGPHTGNGPPNPPNAHDNVSQSPGPVLRKPIDNPDLPNLLRALARGTDAQSNSTHIIFNAAADELDYWRAVEAAKVIGGRS